MRVAKQKNKNMLCFFVFCVLKSIMENKKLVAKKNALIPEFIKVGHQEKRFLAYCISRLNPMKDKDFSRFTVKIGEIAEVFGLPKTSTYPRIREAAVAINSRPIFRVEGKTHKMDWWFSWLDWHEESGEIEVQFNERLVPLLLDLRGGEYTQYRLSMVAGFSNQAWSVYEILKQWLSIRKKHFSLDELKDLLGLVGKYPRWSSFKLYVVDPSIKEINEKSDIEVSYVPEKQKRRIVGLIFRIDKRQPDNVITVESDQDKLQQALMSQGINHKTALKYAQKTESKGLTKVILKKLPGIVKRSGKTAVATTVGKKKSTVIKYILGAIKNELSQGQLFPQESKEPVPVGFTVVTREDAGALAYTGESWDECIARLKKSRIIVQEVTK